MKTIETNFEQINAFKAEDRAKYIGGSDAAGVMGLSKWTSPLKLFLQKTGQLPLDDLSDNEAVYFGSKLEDFIAKEFQTRTGYKVRRHNRDIVHSKYDYLVSHIDRAIVGENAFVECKNYNAYKIKELAEGEAPEDALLQCHHNMMVGDFSYCYLVCLIGGQKFICKKIVRDRELEKKILDAEVNFWQNHVLKNVAPLAMAIDNMEDYFNFGDGEIELEESISEVLDVVADLKATKKTLDKEIKEKENCVKQLMAGYNQAKTERYKITFSESTRRTCDYKKMEQDGVIDKYVTTSSSRRFLVKKNK